MTRPATSPLALEAAPGPARRRRRRTDALVLLGTALLFALGCFFGGFLAFTADIARMKRDEPLDADGIVVLTGGTERIEGAVALLTAGHARRLLISGVHPATSARQIGRLVDAGPSIFDCCVDLDHRAANTIGNALETAKWAESNRFRSLIVVTSNYHMPRSIAELASAMPGVDLKRYPVVPAAFDMEGWYARPGAIVLLLEEYLKYLAARARLGLDTVVDSRAMLAGISP